ncbi:phage regulatory protein/antirepressor Ant [Chromobacterium haemolyticum]|uniref:Phage regulatory protein/antirepressor Ant n=1 Tax=Chromobacterium haemolyticum TaxID=394935 RepID=A0ABS3GNF6_9NEIS|nr:phage regulatory protein/antirepressor Ant [Chromobacterium haemolyticum]MBK0415190.1 phage regulatory protein/antirepressor Ant [Chromobacterium haemolyticum]MBO0416595.1 phage regulatory protein/antirepressor Ant [Chromobacterium haemolyticum]MBO0499829.1 phage regulatory protein/antirepressor Ant [Chromobacterium haemolyticum]QOD84865.1 phage regulatory protein/antirepressor Ant [Chromobacterium haemolyticum]
MNLTILNSGQPLTMSSREIAELCDKRHDHVMRDIRNMLVELYGEVGVPKFGDTHRNPQNGQEYPIFQLPKDLTLTLVAGYNVVLRNRIIKRWMELEERAAAPALPDFSNPAAAARAWAEQFEQRQLVEEQKVLLEHKVAEQAPKVAAQDMLAISKGDLCVRDAAKVLNVSEKRFSQMLIRLAWAYRRQSNGRLVGYTAKEQQGLITHRPVTVYHKSGEVEAVAQLLLTPKGVAKLAELIATGEVA